MNNKKIKHIKYKYIYTKNSSITDMYVYVSQFSNMYILKI